MKYFIIAGEASGDLHGANLVAELKQRDPGAEIQCWGGEKMAKAGAQLLVHYREQAVMGFWEVLVRLGKIYKSLRKCRQQIIDFNPDLLILIDYPGFNLRIAGYLENQGINIYYYISPKVWAWKKSRVKKIRRYVDRMYVIFPFEPEFYHSYGYRVYYFGNPLVEIVEKELREGEGKKEFLARYGLGDKPIISLLAGSRIQEIKRMLPVMTRMSQFYPDYQFVVAGLGAVGREVYENMLDQTNVVLILDNTYGLLVNSVAALVTSGTATLETAIAGIPQVVCYRAGWISYILARLLVKIRFISLVNLIMDKEIVRELIQTDLNEKTLVKELNTILPGGWKREIMMKNYSLLQNKLDGRGASERIADDMFHSIKIIRNVN